MTGTRPIDRLGIFAVLTLTVTCFGCDPPIEAPPSTQGVVDSTEPSPIDRFFPPPTAQILMLGTFHFKDAGLDSYKPRFDVDVLSEERQPQVLELVDRLATWHPTHVAVEWPAERQQELDDRYSSYLAGEFELKANEIYQIGFRLGERLEHPRLWAVDAPKRSYEPWIDPDSWAAAHGQTRLTDSPLEASYEAWYASEDEAKTRRTLREHLLEINRPDAVLRGHGHYLLGSIAIGDGVEYPGADSRTAWYNRNLRIYGNLRRLMDEPGARIFLLIGSGHLPILRHAAEASPEIRPIEVSEVLD